MIVAGCFCFLFKFVIPKLELLLRRTLRYKIEKEYIKLIAKKNEYISMILNEYFLLLLMNNIYKFAYAKIKEEASPFYFTMIYIICK